MLFHNSFFKNLQNLEMFLLQKLRLMYACLLLNTVVSFKTQNTALCSLINGRKISDSHISIELGMLQ